MKKTRVHRGHDAHHAPGRRRGSLLWIALGVLAVATLSAAPWLLRARTTPATGTAGGDAGLRERTAELVGNAYSIRLMPEQEKVKADALSAVKAPCGNRNSLAVRCCGCNLFKSIGGLANHMIAREGANAARVHEAVLDWIYRTNPAGYSGAACDLKRCERPFREDGCGGMSEARLVF
jgi:hypothetical protein